MNPQHNLQTNLSSRCFQILWSNFYFCAMPRTWPWSLAQIYRKLQTVLTKNCLGENIELTGNVDLKIAHWNLTNSVFPSIPINLEQQSFFLYFCHPFIPTFSSLIAALCPTFLFGSGRFCRRFPFCFWSILIFTLCFSFAGLLALFFFLLDLLTRSTYLEASVFSPYSILQDQLQA